MGVLTQLKDVGDNGRRRELAREVTKLFFVAEQKGLQQQQTEEFGHVLCKLLSDMQVEERVDLSFRMSATPNAPHELAVSLASDDIEVARPMLTNSTVLTDDDLVFLADEKGEEHRVALARRENISERVTDRLISHEEASVMRTVAENSTALISDAGFSTLARRSTDDTTLLTLLIQRVDIPEDHSRQLLPLLDDEQRKKIVALMSQNSGAALRQVASDAKSKTALKRIDASRQKLEGRTIAKDVELKRMKLADACMKLARERKHKALAILFSSVSLLPETKTFGAIVNADSELLMLLCRALELPYEVFAEIDELRCEMINTERRADPVKQREAFGEVDVEDARKTLRFVNLMINAS